MWCLTCVSVHIFPVCVFICVCDCVCVVHVEPQGLLSSGVLCTYVLVKAPLRVYYGYY